MSNQIEKRLIEAIVLVILGSFGLNIMLYADNYKLTRQTEENKLQLESSRMVIQSMEINSLLMEEKIVELQSCCKKKK